MQFWSWNPLIALSYHKKLKLFSNNYSKNPSFSLWKSTYIIFEITGTGRFEVPVPMLVPIKKVPIIAGADAGAD